MKEAEDKVIEDEYGYDESIYSEQQKDELAKTNPPREPRKSGKRDSGYESKEEELKFKIDKLFSKSRTEEVNILVDKPVGQVSKSKLKARCSDTELKKKAGPFLFDLKKMSTKANSRLKTSLSSKSNSTLQARSYRLKRRETTHLDTSDSQDSKINDTKQPSLKKLKSFDEFITKTKGKAENTKKSRVKDILNLSARKANLKVFSKKGGGKYRKDHK